MSVDIIQEVKENTVMKPIHLTVKQWYYYLLEKFVTTREIDQEGRGEQIPNRIEELSPNVQWGGSYRLARLYGLSPSSSLFSSNSSTNF
jgi:hypothetical protein